VSNGDIREGERRRILSHDEAQRIAGEIAKRADL
jgi:hypothetical protein